MQTTETWDTLNPQLHEKVTKAIKENLKFETMMPVQKITVPLMLKNHDVAVEAQTGSGKTLAFLLPLLHSYAKSGVKLKKYDIYSIIIVPTRELAKQIQEVLDILRKDIFEELKTQLLIGGKSTSQDIESFVQNGANILVGTTGKLKEIIDHQDIKEHMNLKSLEILILDEADRLMDSEFYDDIQAILSCLPKQRRTSLFSATLNTQRLTELIKFGLRNPVKVSLKQGKQSDEKQDFMVPSTLFNEYLLLENRQSKIEFLVNFILQNNQQKVILFLNTCSSVDFYSKLFQSMPVFKKIKISAIHGNLKQKKRTKVIENFTAQKTGLLLATDVIARGIDFNDVEQIVQLDPPQDPSQFIHRIGRTARTGRQGKALLLLDENEKDFIYFLQVKNVKIEEFDKKSVNIKHDITNFKNMVLEALKKDRDLIEKAKAGFTSFIRSYKEHDLKYIFQFKNLDIGNVANSFFLLRLPRIKEILGQNISTFKQSDIKIDEIEFKDKNQGKQFQQKKEAQVEMRKQREEEQKKKLEEFQKKKDVKNKGHIRRKQKRERFEEDCDDFQEENNLVKKLKQGKITVEQFNEKMKQFDPDELDDVQYTKKLVVSTCGGGKKKGRR